MPLVEITIAGRRHNVQCGDGEEPRLRKLAAYLDGKAQEIGRGGAGMPAMPEAELLLLAGLFITDELFDAYAELQRWRAEGSREAAGLSAAAIEALDRVSARLEQLAAALETT